jgi:chromosomal replication initiation ATPase DnaA
MLYESLHEDDGEALTELEDVLIQIKSFRDWVNIEIDLVREICKEYENDEDDDIPF